MLRRVFGTLEPTLNGCGLSSSGRSTATASSAMERRTAWANSDGRLMLESISIPTTSRTEARVGQSLVSKMVERAQCGSSGVSDGPTAFTACAVHAEDGTSRGHHVGTGRGYKRSPAGPLWTALASGERVGELSAESWNGSHNISAYMAHFFPWYPAVMLRGAIYVRILEDGTAAKS